MIPVISQVGNTLNNATEQWFPKWDGMTRPFLGM